MWKESLALVVILAGGLAVVGQDPPARFSFRGHMQARPATAEIIYRWLTSGQASSRDDRVIAGELTKRFANLCSVHNLDSPPEIKSAEEAKYLRSMVTVMDIAAIAKAQDLKMASTIAEIYPHLVDKYGVYPPDMDKSP